MKPDITQGLKDGDFVRIVDPPNHFFNLIGGLGIIEGCGETKCLVRVRRMGRRSVELISIPYGGLRPVELGDVFSRDDDGTGLCRMMYLGEQRWIIEHTTERCAVKLRDVLGGCIEKIDNSNARLCVNQAERFLKNVAPRVGFPVRREAVEIKIEMPSIGEIDDEVIEQLAKKLSEEIGSGKVKALLDRNYGTETGRFKGPQILEKAHKHRKEESIMELNIKKVTMLNCEPLSSYSDDEVLKILERADAHIKRLEMVSVKTKRIEKQIKRLKEQRDLLVSELDAAEDDE